MSDEYVPGDPRHDRNGKRVSLTDRTALPLSLLPKNGATVPARFPDYDTFSTIADSPPATEPARGSLPLIARRFPQLRASGQPRLLPAGARQGRAASRQTGGPAPFTDEIDANYDMALLCGELDALDVRQAATRRSSAALLAALALLTLVAIGVVAIGVSAVMRPPKHVPLPMAVLAKADRLSVGGAR